ncbi:MAG: hypothetical protein ABR583_00775 [Gaiellaceae bacterium]
MPVRRHELVRLLRGADADDHVSPVKTTSPVGACAAQLGRGGLVEGACEDEQVWPWRPRRERDVVVL